MSSSRQGYDARLALVTLLTTMTACGQAPVSSVYYLDESQLAAVDRDRERAQPTEVHRLLPLFEVSPPRADSWSFRMQLPRSVLVLREPGCVVVVADALDNALHWFRGFPPTYHRSVYLGGRDVSLVRTLTSATSDMDSTIVVSDASSATVVWISRDGELRAHARLSPQYLSAGAIPAVRLALGRPGVVYELPLLTPNTAPLPGEGLIRVWNRRGELEGALGTTAHTEAPLFTGALNQGALAARGDSLWYARFADARVFTFLLDGSGGALVDTWVSPLYFEMPPPSLRIAIDSLGPNEGYSLALRRHLHAFTMDPDGSFVFAQARGDGHDVLATVTRSTGAYRSFDLGVRRIYDVAITRDLLYVIADTPAQSGTARILVYRHPLLPAGIDSEGPRCTAESEAGRGLAW